jgi:predicted N-formylglutamate amidohydrolase
MNQLKVIITCEHGGNEVPSYLQGVFEDAGEILRSHRGWDPGALDLGRNLALETDSPFFYSELSRLVIEKNRSLHHTSLVSEYTKVLSKEDKQLLIEKYYTPYRSEIENQIANLLAEKHEVLHLSIHTFTPTLGGIERRADIGLLFDPARKQEKGFCEKWRMNIHTIAPNLKVRFNFPYLGTADGFTSFLRKKHHNGYAGIEIEVNQKYVDSKGKFLNQGLKTILSESLKASLM